MKNIHIATFTMPIAYIIGKFRPTRLPTPLKLGKHRLTARFTNYILHQFNSFSGYSFLDSSFLFFSSSSSESGCSSALGKFHPRDPTPWSPSTVVSGQNLNAEHFLHPTAMAMGQIVMCITPSMMNWSARLLKLLYRGS